MLAALSESEQNTKGILTSTIGKVLVIDEAYRLFTRGISDRAGSQSNSYRTAVIDTLVAEVQSTPSNDRYILLLGYKELIEEIFQRVNPSLSRRFPIDQAFVFNDFTSSELDAILILKLKEQGFDITDRSRYMVLEILKRSQSCPRFSNTGEIDNLLNTAKIQC